ncbi:hypothetical protein POM88_042890 [Heracleum sosnowskyi]|uniref:Letm1 RBD domain-containing protein n=1 Tax=Heracleum sosnowskyi TaxID=360622 RepID=A0AAD8HHH7_9APIA|nr:hypothetical protein POM88_042890 [Heracleum sosnowskyi]
MGWKNLSPIKRKQHRAQNWKCVDIRIWKQKPNLMKPPILLRRAWNLTEADLHKACRARGIHVAEDMSQQLCDWLDLSLNHSLPSSLLMLSRASIVTGQIRSLRPSPTKDTKIVSL